MAERLRIPTPQPATPKAIAEVVSQVVDHFRWDGPVGITFPGWWSTERSARPRTSTSRGSASTPASSSAGSSRASAVINDADAAAWRRWPSAPAKNNQGVVLVLTIGTGIGSALFMGGKLVPNTEFGHLELKGKEAESRASDAARDKRDMSWDKYAKRIGEYLRHGNALQPRPDGHRRRHQQEERQVPAPMIDLRTKVVPAKLMNEAGIIGAALAADTMDMPSSRTTTRRTSTTRRATSALIEAPHRPRHDGRHPQCHPQCHPQGGHDHP